MDAPRAPQPALRQISDVLGSAAEELSRVGLHISTATPLGREAGHDAALADVCDAAGLSLRKFAAAVEEDARTLRRATPADCATDEAGAGVHA